MAEILINTNDRRIQYTASGGQTVFAYDFPIYVNTHITVVRNRAGTITTRVLTTDYTVSGVGVEGGGNITLTSGATAGDVMTLYGSTPFERTSDYGTGGDFKAATVNKDFDWLTMLAQQNDRNASLAIRANIYDETTDLTLPLAADRASKVLVFDPDGNVDVETLVNVGTTVSTFMATTLVATDVDDFGTLLGFGRNVANTFSANQTINGTTNTPFTVSWTDSGASVGPVIYNNRVSASPAINDVLGRWDLRGSTSVTQRSYAGVGAFIVNSTDATYEGTMTLSTAINGTFADRVYINSGMRVGLPTGGDKGAGTINTASAIYVDNNAVYYATGTDVPITDGGTGASTASDARTNLGLGTLATQNGTFSGTSSGTNTGDQTSVSGNAGTATTLQTPRNINGVSFNGSANITVDAAAGSLTGTTLVAAVVASSLTSVGTLTGGATGAGFTVALATSTITGILGSVNGGTANGFTKFTGPAASEKTFTLPNASDSIACAGQANAFTANQTIDGTNNTPFTVTWTDAGATVGPVIYNNRVSASPATNDVLGRWDLRGSTDAQQRSYAGVGAFIVTATDATYAGTLTLSTAVAGTFADRVYVTNGLRVGLPTGGDQGAGTINVSGAGYYVNGVLLPAGCAAAADQETATSTTLAVVPGVQQRHPSAAKCWLKAGVTGNILASYNITSLTDTGTGDLAITIATDFSGADAWTCIPGGERTSSTGTATLARDISIKTGTMAAGTVSLECWDKTATTNVIKDPNTWHMVGFGDQ